MKGENHSPLSIMMSVAIMGSLDIEAWIAELEPNLMSFGMLATCKTQTANWTVWITYPGRHPKPDECESGGYLAEPVRSDVERLASLRVCHKVDQEDWKSTMLLCKEL